MLRTYMTHLENNTVQSDTVFFSIVTANKLHAIEAVRISNVIIPGIDVSNDVRMCHYVAAIRLVEPNEDVEINLYEEPISRNRFKLYRSSKTLLTHLCNSTKSIPLN